MHESDPSFETLSAYVDGELDAASAARIAHLAASDPTVALRLAKLHQLRAGVSALTGTEVVLAPAVGRRSRDQLDIRSWSVALAGCFILLISAAALWFSTNDARQDGGSLVAALVETHDEWLTTGRVQLAPTNLPESERSILLAAAGLIQIHADPSLVIGGKSVGHFGYVGANGCRLSLFELPVDESASITGNLWVSIESDLRLADWVAGTTHFIVVARDMNEQRFETVVRALRTATHRQGTTREMVARLQAARQPCFT